MARFDEYVARGKREYPEKFSDAKLAPQFVPYYNSRERVRVQFSYGETLTGTIGATTGWVPCFLLMRRSSDRGSSWTLSKDDCVVAIKRGRKYVEVREVRQ